MLLSHSGYLQTFHGNTLVFYRSYVACLSPITKLGSNFMFENKSIGLHINDDDDGDARRCVEKVFNDRCEKYVPFYIIFHLFKNPYPLKKS